jgi:hypothetical protein
MRWGGHVACIGELRSTYKTMVETPQGKRPLGRPQHKWEENIIKYFRETGCEVVDWIKLVQNSILWWTLSAQ